ncbi:MULTISPECIES: hypothetical protein [Ralstonia solanacearum species complex]|uniref:Uncharacterized protein n=3 Tax=Ralstonia solanacearum TaxID=305 RepID=A0A7U7PQB8_RALSL|nr:hypothetical protein [Ralstonia solanacearum]ALF89905.1 hypothetical protein RSUY_35940 [Ralstonia solanacearum]ATI29401.1 hypothetical protein CCY86_17975 [Ralstonia solanacearum]EAP72140.1 Hypothetical Protein RRSL_01711 [Ralstonia solanacearum UW551]KEI31670.1 hypothetical protein CQ06_21275 [Ralstonia solanacearum]KFX27403.1 hypothetical protein KR96_18460 [Ralstonia solanacearum]
MRKIVGDVEIVPRAVPVGPRGWQARVDVVVRDAAGQSLSGSRPVPPRCTFGSPREALDAALLYGQRLLRDWAHGAAVADGHADG